MINRKCSAFTSCQHYNLVGNCDGCGAAEEHYITVDPALLAPYIHKYTIDPIDDFHKLYVKPIFKCIKKMEIEQAIVDVIFDPPATIVYWADGTKTVVKAQNNEPFDSEKGLAMAICKKMISGNEGWYFDIIKKWTEPWEAKQKEYFKKLGIMEDLHENQ